jgi:hypothetical protein
MNKALYNVFSRPTIIKIGDKFVGSSNNPRFVKNVESLFVSTRKDAYVFNGYASAYKFKLMLIKYMSENEITIEQK